MQRRFTYLILFFCVSSYVFSTIGISVFTHYCGDEIESISLFLKSKNCCGDDNEPMNCCKDEVKHLSLKSDFTFLSVNKKLAPFFHILFFNSYFIQIDASLGSHQLVVYFRDRPRPPNLIQKFIVETSILRI